jgi:iron complex transport system substrate-binding protein
LKISVAVSAILLLLLTLTGFAKQPNPPKRIISLIPSVTRSLYLLGLQDNILAVTIFCPPIAKNKEKIGSILEPDIEKIISLKPDIVIASKEGNRQETVAKLRSLGITVYVTGNVDSFSAIYADFIQLGDYLGYGDKARAVVDDSRKRISALRDKLKNVKPMTIFYEVGAQPLFTSGNKSFANDIIEAAGAKNIFGDLSSRFPQVSREEVVRRDPDVIILVAMGNVNLKEKTQWENFKSLKAVKNGRVYFTDDTSFTDPTPKSAADASERLSEILFPEVFK